jgi:RNA-directed DNA polymerase
VRYVDDLVVLCRNENEAQESLRRLTIIMTRLNLRLNPGKTRVVDIMEGHDGFDFLGFHYRKCKSLRNRGYYLLRWPGNKAMKAIREKVKSIVGKRSQLSRSSKEAIALLNPVLRGWGNYFSVGNSSKQFNAIDRYVTERLCLFLSKKHGVSGRGWAERWSHIDFRKEGLHKLSGTVKWMKRTTNADGRRVSESRMR